MRPFLKALADEDLRRVLAAAVPVSVQDALTRALLIEAAINVGMLGLRTNRPRTGQVSQKGTTVATGKQQQPMFWKRVSLHYHVF